MQDIIRKASKEELPDFYNIQLERPKDDPAGFDVLFIDAASKVCDQLWVQQDQQRALKMTCFAQATRMICSLQGAFASRMSHSCTPNCQAVVMACNGRLTIAVYTLRYVQAGEELTFDYSSVTESEKEFRCGCHPARLVITCWLVVCAAKLVL